MTTQSHRVVPAHQGIFYIAYAITAIAVFGASAVSPVLPDIGAAFGVDGGATSYLVSLFILPMVLLTLPIGYLTARISLKPMLIASLILYGFSGLACALAPSFEILLAARILQGCGAAALELFGLVILIETASGAERDQVIGRNVGIIGLSTTLAPLISGVLSLISWQASFLSALVAFPLAYWVLRGLPKVERKTSGPRPALGKFLQQAPVQAALFATLVVFLFLFGIQISFVPERAAELGLNSGLGISLISASAAVAIGLVAPRVAPLMGGIGRGGVSLLGFCAYAAACVVFILAPGPWWLFAGAMLIGAGHGLIFPLIQMTLAGHAPAHGMVVFMALNITAIGVGQTLSPMLMSAVYSYASLASVFWLGLLVALVMMPLSWAFFRRTATVSET